jgi:hypothetical protein
MSEIDRAAEARQDDLDVVAIVLREEGPQRPVGEAGGENGVLGGSALALDEAARDLTGGVHLLFKLDLEGEEVDPLARLVRRGGGRQDDGLAVGHEDRAAGLLRHAARLERQRAAGQLH